MTINGTATIVYRELKHYKYELLEQCYFDLPFTVESDIVTKYVILKKSGQLIILQRYAWDGPSGPAPDDPKAMKASLVHDALCQLISMSLLPYSYKPKVDHVLEVLLEQDGMDIVRATLWERAVNWFGSFWMKFSKKDPQDDVHTAGK